jgi:hypothetical protein
MRRWIGVFCAGAMLLAACGGDDERLADGPAVNDGGGQEGVQSVPQDVSVPIIMTVVPGCDTAQMEDWYEGVSFNAKAFRDQSVGATAMGIDMADDNVSSLSDMRDGVYNLAVPECVATLHRQIQLFMDNVIASFIDFMNGTIQQDILAQEVSAAQANFDATILPELQGISENLSDRLRDAATTP